MSYLSDEEKRSAKENLEKAFNDIKWQHSPSFGFDRAELSFQGISSLSGEIDKYKREINELKKYIESKDKDTNEYLHHYCPAFYKSMENSITKSWEKDSEQIKNAENRIKQAIVDIDSYADSKNSNIAKDFKSENNSSSLSRPWGTAIRQKLANAVGLEKKVDSLWTLGLNSLANADHVNLGDHFTDLLQKDHAIKIIVAEIEEKITSDIKRNSYKAPFLTAQTLSKSNFSGRTRSVGWGGERHPDGMFKQLKTTILNPFKSFSEYSATWEVGLNELTWSIRNTSVQYCGVYHAVYNAYGFAFIWEFEFAIEDTLDLRPRSGKNIDFGGKTSGEKAYNTVTSILGTAYHDIIGNTDKLKVRASWKHHGNGENITHSW